MKKIKTKEILIKPIFLFIIMPLGGVIACFLLPLYLLFKYIEYRKYQTKSNLGITFKQALDIYKIKYYIYRLCVKNKITYVYEKSVYYDLYILKNKTIIISSKYRSICNKTNLLEELSTKYKISTDHIYEVIYKHNKNIKYNDKIIKLRKIKNLI